MATTRIPTLPSFAHFELVKAEKSKELFDSARAQSRTVEGTFGNVVLSSSGLVGCPFEQTVLTIVEILVAGRALYDQQWKRAGYHFTSVVLIDPLRIVSSLISQIIRVAASILSFFSSDVALRSWSIAEGIDIVVLQLKTSLFDTFSLGHRLGAFKEEDEIVPESAVNYLGKEASVEVVVGPQNPSELAVKAQAIVTAFQSLLQFMINTDVKRTKELLHYDALLNGQEISVAPNIKKLLETFSENAIEEAPKELYAFDVYALKELFEYLRIELSAPGLHEAVEKGSVSDGARSVLQGVPQMSSQNNPFNVQTLRPYMRPVELALSERFGFGRVFYYY